MSTAGGTSLSSATRPRSNIGIELASEHAARATSGVLVRNNFVYRTAIGITIGGYDSRRGRTENCTIMNNTLYGNDTDQSTGGEILVQYDTRNNLIENNIIFAGPQHVVRGERVHGERGQRAGRQPVLLGRRALSEGTWSWKGVGYGDFD